MELDSQADIRALDFGARRMCKGENNALICAASA
jgi:hypothetical protein